MTLALRLFFIATLLPTVASANDRKIWFTRATPSEVAIYSLMGDRPEEQVLWWMWKERRESIVSFDISPLDTRRVRLIFAKSAEGQSEFKPRVAVLVFANPIVARNFLNELSRFPEDLSLFHTESQDFFVPQPTPEFFPGGAEAYQRQQRTMEIEFLKLRTSVESITRAESQFAVVADVILVPSDFQELSIATKEPVLGEPYPIMNSPADFLQKSLGRQSLSRGEIALRLEGIMPPRGRIARICDAILDLLQIHPTK